MFCGLVKALILTALCVNTVWAENLPEIRVIASVEEMVTMYKDLNYWGDVDPGKILEAPPLLIVATVKAWRQEAAAMNVDRKKELFYRSLLPLVLYSNTAIAGERKRLSSIKVSHDVQGTINEPDTNWLLKLAIRYRAIKQVERKEPVLPRDDQLDVLFNELLVRVDIVPASLALGQGAYESGYGTSRFALEGNSLFGQWTFDGKGMAPKERRANKGNYGVAAYEWPLDSVRSYMLNLNSHRAYAGLRNRRAELRTQKQTISGEALAQTLTHYSERGMDYVNELTGMMRFNGLDVADKARLSQEPLVLVVNATDESDTVTVTTEIAELRASGELAKLINSMGVVTGSGY